MQMIYLALSLLSMYKVSWTNDYITVDLYDDMNEVFDLPEARLYSSDNKLLSKSKNYIKGVNRTSLSVVNSRHVKVFKVDYRVYFNEYNIDFDHTITFEVIDSDKPVITGASDITMPINSKVLTEKELIQRLVITDNYYSLEELSIRVKGLDLINTKVVGDNYIYYEVIDPSNNKTEVRVKYSIINNEMTEIKYNLPLKMEVNTPFLYNDYFTIKDKSDPNPSVFVDTSKIDFNNTGTYTIKVLVINNGGIKTEIEEVFTIVDTTKPELLIESSRKINIGHSKEILLDYIIDVSDNYNELSKNDVNIIHNIDFNVIGKYEVTYEVTDSSLNKTTKKLSLEIIDLKEPTYTIIKDLIIEVNSININYFEYFEFNDNHSSSEELKVTFKDSKINYKLIGNYMLELTLVDNSKNQIIRNIPVVIVDNTNPNVQQIEELIFHDFKDKTSDEIKQYFSIEDNYDSYNNIKLELLDKVKFNIVGEYNVNILFYDSSNNETIINTVIYILDNKSPEIILKQSVINVNIGSYKLDYNNYLISYSDNYTSKNNLIINIGSNIDYSNIGLYYISYSVVDESYNETIELIEVYVDVPYEKLITGNDIYLNYNEEHIINMGVSFSDNVVEVITFPKIIDTKTPGTKEIIYIAYDSRGNYDEYKQLIFIDKNKEINYKKYIPLILVNVSLIGYGFYEFYKYKRGTKF